MWKNVCSKRGHIFLPLDKILKGKNSMDIRIYAMTHKQFEVASDNSRECTQL